MKLCHRVDAERVVRPMVANKVHPGDARRRNLKAATSCRPGSGREEVPGQHNFGKTRGDLG